MANAITYITQLNINGSAAYQFAVLGTAYISGPLKVGAYTLPTADGAAGEVLCTNGSGTVGWGVGGGGGGCWTDTTDPYITPCNGCGLSLNGDIFDSTSTHHLGVAMSPGAFADVNAACGMFTTCVSTGYVYSSGQICLGGYVCGANVYASGDMCAGDDITAGDLITGTRLNINASSACTFYVSGTGVYSGTLGITYACTTCACASRRLVIPVGTNCY